MTFNDYVGIPWVLGGNSVHGADCWGLTTLVEREVYDIDISQYDGSKASGDELTAIIESELSQSHWKSSDKQPRAGDVILAYDRDSGKPGHVGVFIGDGNILHSPDHNGSGAIHRTSAIHPIRLIRNIFLKLEFYRYDNCS